MEAERLRARTVAAQSSLPFDLPAPAALQKSGKKVFAHYLPSMPVSFDNRDGAEDTWATAYLPPRGEGGRHAAYGGFSRDRPLPREERSEDSWALADAEGEVRQAQAEGIDGFTLDLLQLPGDKSAGGASGVWTHTRRMMQAAQNAGNGFKIMLMPDMNASAQSQNVDTLAKYVSQLAAYPSAYRLSDGRVVVSPFIAERKTVQWWANFAKIMNERYRTPIALVPLFLHEIDKSKAYAPVSYGMSHWGARNPEQNDPGPTYGSSRVGRVEQIHKLGKLWMQPVSVQDARPRSGLFEEAENTRNLRNTWEIAIKSDSDWVQLATWNDYPEGTHMAPSARNGWSWLDIDAYYLTWFKAGKAPTIVRDAVYLTHRNQFVAARPSFPQTKLMELIGGSPARDTVEALTFLTRPGTVQVTVGSTTTSCQAPAGVGVCTVPLRAGSVSAAVVRGGSTVAAVRSAVPVSARPVVQDLEYIAGSSLRTPAARPPVPAPSPRTPAPSPSGPDDGLATVRVAPASDAYANAGAPARAFGGSTSLASSGVPGLASYLRFNLPKAPPGKKLTGATLRLRTTTEGIAGSRERQTVRFASNSWKESSVTWSTRPALSPTTLGVLAGGSSRSTTYRVPLLVSRLSGRLGTQQTLAITGPGRDGLWVWSREQRSAGYRPQLILTFR